MHIEDMILTFCSLARELRRPHVKQWYIPWENEIKAMNMSGDEEAHEILTKKCKIGLDMVSLQSEAN